MFPNPSTPPSPFGPASSSANAVASSSQPPIQPQRYASSGYYESAPNGSPSMLPAPLPHKEDHHVLIHNMLPNEGVQGTSVKIKCDVTFPPSPPPSTLGPESETKPQTHGRALRVVFGSHPVQTQVSVLGGANQNGGQLCELLATVPSWSTTGAASMGRGSKIPVYVQVLDGAHAIIETVHSGEFTFAAKRELQSSWAE
jgi:hypothetical protein